MGNNERPDLVAIRTRLSARRGREYWRSLEELAGGPEFDNFLENEFRHELPAPSELNRRDLLRLMGASLALAGLSACTKQPAELIVPYVRAPEQIIPGKPLFFATAMPICGLGVGVLAESHMGRPTKIEGNPQHPASLGATDAVTQASVLTLYDPDRSQVAVRQGRISSWVTFSGEMARERTAQALRRGAGLRLLTEPVSSPSLTRLIQQDLARDFPEAKWIQYDAGASQAGNAGAALAFGRPVNTIYRFDAANVVLSIGADFMGTGPAALRYSRDFMKNRRLREGQKTMNRLYVVEPCPTVTGSVADHRFPMRASELESFARSIYGELSGGPGAGGWASAIARDLKAQNGAAVVIAGDDAPPAVHALAHAINGAIGAAGKTLSYTEPLEANPTDQMAALRELVGEMNAGKIDLLLILGGNPVYDAPADLEFAKALQKVRMRAHLSLYEDETSELCHWHIPQAHYLESWGDIRAYDGTVTIQQPLIAPLYGGRTTSEVVAVMAGRPNLSPHEIVRNYWTAERGAAPAVTGAAQQQQRGPSSTAGVSDFETWWQTALHDGVVPNTALPTVTVSAKPPSATQPAGGGIELVFRPDPTIGDGRWANNGWLQELPKPVSKLTWDNAAFLSPATAQRNDVVDGDVIEVRHNGRSVRAPVYISPGNANDSVTLFLGYGRTRAGKLGNGLGYNAYRIRTASAPLFVTGAEIRKTGETVRLANTQDHHAVATNAGAGREYRDLMRVTTLSEYGTNPHFAQGAVHAPDKELTIYPEWNYRGYAWGMAIDQNACIGCSACVVACNAENNIPVVGKDQVLRGREMHWLRIDRYYRGDEENPEIHHQPMLCQHCETAPCEPVCPVAATAHSSEGLNQMIYNRCVGTRYCSNNCPYKVRRFNFYNYNDWNTPSLHGLRNPDVTVRSRGVMEKCTFCVQRIQAAKIDSEKEDRRVRDGEIITACQAACPTDAIVFGDINDKNSVVAKLKAQPLNYALLADLNTRPRTTYLGKVRNPNPEIERA
jgi:molybdopterin-containing oxidoreductase family iron-sulfur binding subunit